MSSLPNLDFEPMVTFQSFCRRAGPEAYGGEMRGIHSTDAAVIGAGPYGLAVASHLLQAGISTQVFGVPMGAWRYNMPAGMLLKSRWEATSISTSVPGSTLVEYCAHSGSGPCSEDRPIPIGLFVDYGLQIQQRYVPGVNTTGVTGVMREGQGFRLQLANGETLVANKVIAATGHACFAYTPPTLRSIAAEAGGSAFVSHTRDHADFESFRGREVAVVGAGQSALETAVLLREAGARVHLLVRGPALKWGGPPVPPGSILRRVIKPETPFGPGWSHVVFTRGPELFTHFPASVRRYLANTTYGPSGAWWLKQRFDEKIEVSTGTVISSAKISSGKIRLGLTLRAGTATLLDVDHVIAATGYEVDVNAIEYLEPPLRAAISCIAGTGIPALSRNFESSVKGLYFVGLVAAATFGPLQRFVHGSGFAAQTVCRALSSNAAPLVQPQKAAA